LFANGLFRCASPAASCGTARIFLHCAGDQSISPDHVQPRVIGPVVVALPGRRPSAFSGTWVLRTFLTLGRNLGPADTTCPRPHLLCRCFPRGHLRAASLPISASCVRGRGRSLGTPPQHAGSSCGGHTRKSTNSVSTGEDSTSPSRGPGRCHSIRAVIGPRLLSPLIGAAREFLIQWICLFSQSAARQFQEAAPDRP
jgi:hypothetical protein